LARRLIRAGAGARDALDMSHSPNATPTATFTSAGGARAVTAGPTSIRLLLEASHGGAYSVLEFRAAPGFAGPPMPHHHTREEASFIVLEGALTLDVGGEERHVAAGGLAHLPPGIDFTWRNASSSEPARFLCVYSPAGFEQMFAEAAQAFGARGGPPTPAAMREIMPPLWAKYGIGLATHDAPR